MSEPVIDLAQRAFTFSRKGLTAIGTWIKIDGRWRPCMAIIRTGDELNPACRPCIVAADNAWIWDENIGDPRRTAHVVVDFLKALRMDMNRPQDHIDLVLFVQDHLGDLLGIPPRPPQKGEVVAELTMTETDTGRVREVEVRDDV